jgi:phage tail-like protein
MAAGDREKDPYLSFRFVVEIDGIIVGGFSEVLGLQVEIDTEEYQEGGVNDHVHHLLKAAKYPRLVLKRGITNSDVLWKWQKQIVDGAITKETRKTINIVLLDTEKNERWGWRCIDAYPVKWAGPDLNATGNNIAIESLELVHAGIRSEKGT